MTSSPSERSARPVGLRERKKAATRAAIQLHALRLFREQGYAQTTVDQIAEAAEISPSTFFRYFPTKEETVLYDELDPILIEAFTAQPEDLSPIAAIRATLREVFTRLPAEDLEREKSRQALVFAVPELRAATLDQFSAGLTMLAEAAAVRSGREKDDFAVRIWAGAIVGVALAAFLAIVDDPAPDFVEGMDRGFALLEEGLPL
ncbi:TetR family transcriptional regulator [Amycolatopsis sp.]|jgi:AcrR family transcriptional regulator|uniref:acyl-CoA-like ligand-binding transcription factor n=1 Tax=Amycolatopsis sp. TaxID=37632 RepID=UPI002DF90F0B|nr:TetR family transcriptional regulator [Amycolatopsis sp.]